MWSFPVSYLVLESLRSQFLVEGSDLGGKTLKVVFYLQLLKLKANTVQRDILQHGLSAGKPSKNY